MKALFRIVKILLVLAVLVALGTIAINAYCILGTRAQVRTISQVEAQLRVVDASGGVIGAVQKSLESLSSSGVDVEGVLSNITGGNVTLDGAASVARDAVAKSAVPADAIVVLGASVFSDGRPSDILADRLEVAADLYKSGAAGTVIASGDNRTEHYNESEAMKNYLVKMGVPESAIQVDPQGYDTYSSIYRARYEYGATKILVVTQAYHLYRALMISNLLGCTSLGVAADKGAYDNQAEYSIRDAFARDKDFFFAILKVPPTA